MTSKVTAILLVFSRGSTRELLRRAGGGMADLAAATGSVVRPGVPAPRPPRDRRRRARACGGRCG